MLRSKACSGAMFFVVPACCSWEEEVPAAGQKFQQLGRSSGEHSTAHPHIVMVLVPPVAPPHSPTRFTSA